MSLNGILVSAQPFSITIATSASSNTATISSVTAADTLILWHEQRAASATLDPSKDAVQVTLTNGTTITAITQSADAVITRIVHGVALTFKPGILQSCQYGTVSASAATTGNATISAVVVANAAPLYLGYYKTGAAWNLIRDEAALTLTSTTNVRLTRGNFTAGDVYTASFCVPEFASGILQSLQTANVATGAGSLTGTATISSVTEANCLMGYSGMRQSVLGTSDTRHLAYVQQTAATTLTVTRSLAGTTEISNVAVTVFEFKAGWIKSRQEVINTIASGNSSNDAAISAVDTALSVINSLGRTQDGTLAADTRMNSTVLLLDTDTLRTENGGTPLIARISSSEVVEFFTPVQIDIPAGSLTLAGQTVVYKQSYIMALGALALTAQTTTLSTTNPIPAGSLTLTTLTPTLQNVQTTYFVDLGTLLLSTPEISLDLNPYSEITDGTNTYDEILGASSNYYDKKNGVVPDTIFLTLETKNSTYGQGYEMAVGSLALSSNAPVSSLKYAIPAGSLILTGRVPTV